MKCPKCQHENPEESTFCGKCGTHITPQPEVPPLVTQTLETSQEELATGSVFAHRYQVIEELGRGGMGKVYKVLDKEINAKIALKLIKPEIAADQRTIERFRNELKTARDISHKNVCRMYDIGKEKNSYFITMEYIEGQDLKGLIRQSGQLAVGTSISIASQICEGLVESHRKGIVHRDLKPSNVMIDKQGDAQIMDFGIARAIQGKGITGAGVMIGTPEYMSPEQVEGKDVDARSDLYSVGIILYEMLTGRVPFEGDTPFTVGVKQKSETPADPKEFNQDIPSDLSALILKCLEKEKDNRFQSAGGLLSELERIKQRLPSSERQVTRKAAITSKEITVSLNVRKVVIPVVSIFAVILVAVLVRKPWQRKAPAGISDKPSLAIMYFKNNTGDQNLDHWRTALSDSIITDLSQSRYLDVLSSDQLFSILRRLNLLEAANYATEDLRKVAAEGGVEFALMGSLSKAGDTFRIDYLIQEISTGKNRGANRMEGRGDESLFSLVDEITRKIKQEFDLSPEQLANDFDRDIGTISTFSTEAYKYYAQGRQAYSSGETRKSIALLERAVATDPEFAMAYRQMSIAYEILGYGAERNEFMRKAFELRQRLSDREKYTIEGDFFRRSESTYDKALESYNKVLELYPNDIICNQNSAMIYLDLEQWDKAIERAEITRRSKIVQAYTLLAGAYSRKGQYDEARDVVVDYIENIQDSAYLRRRLAWIYCCQGEINLAIDEIDKAIAMDPENSAYAQTRGDITLFAGKYEASRIEFKRLMERADPLQKIAGIRGLSFIASLQGNFSEATRLAIQGIDISRAAGQKGNEIGFRERLAEINLYLGKIDEARFQIDIAWPYTMERGDQDQKLRVLVDRGICYLMARSPQDAVKSAEELKELIESGLSEKAMRYYDYLMGLIEFENRDYSRAVDHLQRAKSLLPAEWPSLDAQAKYFFALGQAQHKSGNLDGAMITFEEITRMTYGRHYCQHLYTLAYYELGRVFQDQGDIRKAIDNYEQFLSLWKNADPGLPEVEDARKRLAGLKRS